MAKGKSPRNRKIAVLVALIAVAAVSYILYVAPLPMRPSNECASDIDCMAAGCSGQLCVAASNAQNVITTCEWSEKYGCVRLTRCSCIAGSCAWKNTSAYSECLASLGG